MPFHLSIKRFLKINCFIPQFNAWSLQSVVHSSCLSIFSNLKITLNSQIMSRQESTLKKLKMLHSINCRITLICLKIKEVLMLKNLLVKLGENLFFQNKIRPVWRNFSSKKRLAVQWQMHFKRYKQKQMARVNTLQGKVKKE